MKYSAEYTTNIRNKTLHIHCTCMSKWLGSKKSQSCEKQPYFFMHSIRYCITGYFCINFINANIVSGFLRAKKYICTCNHISNRHGIILNTKMHFTQITYKPYEKQRALARAPLVQCSPLLPSLGVSFPALTASLVEDLAAPSNYGVGSRLCHLLVSFNVASPLQLGCSSIPHHLLWAHIVMILQQENLHVHVTMATCTRWWAL